MNGNKDLLKRMRKYRMSYAFIAPYMLIFIMFTFVPVIIACFFSFTQFNVMESPRWIGLKNFQMLFFRDTVFLTSLRNTLFLSLLIGVTSYFLCIMLAWFINDFGRNLRTLLTFLFYAPTLANVFYVWQLIFSGDANGIVNAWMLNLGIINTPIQFFTDTRYMTAIVIFVLLWSSLGTNFLVLIAGFQNVDRTLYEAGAVDGIKNRWQELWFITLPYMRPQLLFSAVMSITGAFGIGSTIDVLCGNPSTDYKVWTIMNHLQDYGGVRLEMGYACAIAILLFVLMISVNRIAQKLIAKVGE